MVIIIEGEAERQNQLYASLENEYETIRIESEEKALELMKEQFPNMNMTEVVNKDPLTGLLSRSGAVKRINGILERQNYGTFCMLDMDNFKAVNDIYGHIEGDKLLISFANVLQKEAGEHAVIGRIGGDEFIVFLYEKMSHSEIEKCANKIVEAVETRIESPGKMVKISVSMGISVVPHDGCRFEELYGNADKALYYVKNAGKNAVRFYQEPKKIEKKRHYTHTKLKTFKENMKEREKLAGSYMVDFTCFENIYRFMERNIDREKRSVQCVLFTLTGLDAETTKREIIKEEMFYLEDAVMSSLRKGDVTTIYSATQMLVLLMDVDRKNATSVVNRIISEYHKQTENDELNIVYEMEALGEGQIEIHAMNA